MLRHLSSAVDCRTLFATHFHPLASTEFRGSPRVALGHMAALVKEARGANPGSIVFLYELREGACPKSYGLQVWLINSPREGAVSIYGMHVELCCPGI